MRLGCVVPPRADNRVVAITHATCYSTTSRLVLTSYRALREEFTALRRSASADAASSESNTFVTATAFDRSDIPMSNLRMT